MAASITNAGESLIAQKQAARETLEVVRFVLALVPGLDPDGPVDRDALKPPAEQIVHTQAYTQKGFVNPNQVIYSLMMGSDIGDFDWNWIGLETAENVMLSVAYVPVQQKRKNTPPHQLGNNVTRNFLVAFDGALELTAITIDASTWQHDFTVRLAGIDERERMSNRNLFGRACFFGGSLALEPAAKGFQIKPGTAYIEGIRVALGDPFPITDAIAVGKVWLDVCLERQTNDKVASWKVVYGNPVDYTDSAGTQHYCVPIAEFISSTQIVDLRVTEPITGALIQHLAARVGDYPELRARATTKGDVGLDKIPNAISDDPDTNSSEVVASTAALNRLNQQISDALVGMVASFDMSTAPTGWLKRNGANVSRTTYAKLFSVIGTRYGAGDGSSTFNVGDSRGLFIRGLDEGAGRDPGRGLGTIQEGQNLSHAHTASATAVGDHVHGAWTDAQGDHNHTAWTDAQGAHAHSVGGSVHSSGGSASFDGNPVGASFSVATSTDGAHAHNVGIGIAGAHGHNVGIGGAGTHSHDITVNAAGGAEARPVNQALLVCIKY